MANPVPMAPGPCSCCARRRFLIRNALTRMSLMRRSWGRCANRRSLHGTLLATDDRDSLEWTLDQPARFDLSADIPGGSRIYLALFHNDATIPFGRNGRRTVVSARPVAGTGGLPAGDFRPSGPALDYVIHLLPSAATCRANLMTVRKWRASWRRIRRCAAFWARTIRVLSGFDIAVPGHLWELRGVQGLADLRLVDGNEVQIGAWEAPLGALALRLALPPGQYTAHLRGDGPMRCGCLTRAGAFGR